MKEYLCCLCSFHTIWNFNEYLKMPNIYSLVFVEFGRHQVAPLTPFNLMTETNRVAAA